MKTILIIMLSLFSLQAFSAEKFNCGIIDLQTNQPMIGATYSVVVNSYNKVELFVTPVVPNARASSIAIIYLMDTYYVLTRQFISVENGTKYEFLITGNSGLLNMKTIDGNLSTFNCSLL